VRPAPQTEAQTPSLQQVPTPQAFPHAPQFPLSFWRSTHCPLQKTCPAGQTEAHAPSVQQVPSPHALPQVPQWPLSFWKSTHCPLHQV
jgi:hypothetical protein